MPTAKLWVHHASMTTDPSKHIAYLTDGHQRSVDEQVQTWTKSLPKSCKTNRADLVAHWRGIYQKFLQERSTPGSMIRHNAKITAKQFVINLPNDVTPEQINTLAKAVLQDFPRHLPTAMVLHETSNRGKKHLHLQGLFSYRNGGYGGIQEEFRLNITNTMKATVTKELTGYGYHVDQGTPSGITTSERRWLNAQGSVEQRRSPRFMMSLSAIATSPKLQEYCRAQARKMLARMGAPASEEPALNAIITMEQLQSIYTPKENSLRDQSSTGHSPGAVEPLTQQALEHELIKARTWKHTRTISKNFRS